MTKHNTTRMLCEGAMMVAASQVLSFLKLYELPNGGSLTPAMLPIIVFSIRWGWRSGLMAGFAFGLLQLMFDGAYAWGWQSMIGDYLLAFLPLGLAGVFKGQRMGVYFGTLLGCFGRFVIHYVVGATVWAAYMPEEFFGMTMTTPWFYSLLYNASYMVPNTILTLLIAWALYKPMKRFFLGDDIR
ncbi:energy-coupled thiamine transporter ThiT [Bengtsoniella intestinalis]|uniref:energy-coupled thiamine transporter ThiT n=1 Tax=Bengtsoniella intestinalis TaxID=3073143 RepID=UPI00391F6BFC